MTVRPPAGRRAAALAMLLALAMVGWRVGAQPSRLPPPPKFPPAYRNVVYGPHERNVFDLWRAKPEPGRAGTPLVVFFHGGGFRQGNKNSVPSWLVDKCLAAGISVASANYRLSGDAPYPAPMLDGARVIQYLRLHACDFGIDPARIGAAGNSAGAGIALWVGFHDDLADPTSNDPVLRTSSRLACLAVEGAQTSYDPRFIRREIGGRAHEHPALPPFYGLAESDRGTSKAHRIFADASPIEHASPDDPPVYLFYEEPKAPLPADARPGQGIHHPRFGAVLREKLDPIGVECVVRHVDDLSPKEDPEEAMAREMTAFLGRHLRD